MITFRNNKDNNEYLMINALVDGGILIVSDNLPTDVLNEIQKMYFELFTFQKELNQNKLIKKTRVDEVAFKRNSLLGQWLMKNYDQKKIIYKDLFIYYEKVVNALNIAIFEDNEIAKKIIPLFKNQVNGDKYDLLKEHDEEVLDYILNCDNFYEKIEGKEKELEEYIVFENGEYKKIVLSTGKKVLEKKN